MEGKLCVTIRKKILQFKNYLNEFRLSQIGVVSYGSECPSHGVYGRVTEVKHWIQFLAQGAEDTNCKQDIPEQQGNMRYIHWRNYTNVNLLLPSTPDYGRQQ